MAQREPLLGGRPAEPAARGAAVMPVVGSLWGKGLPQRSRRRGGAAKRGAGAPILLITVRVSPPEGERV